MDKEKIMALFKDKKTVGIIITIVSLLVIVIFFGNDKKSYDDFTAKEILDLMEKNDDVKIRITESEDFKTKRKDPNRSLGEEYMYISKVSFTDIDVPETDTDQYSGGSIEVFNNEEDAKARAKYFTYYYDKIEETFPEEEYGEIFDLLAPDRVRCYIFQEKNVLLRVSGRINKNDVRVYEAAFYDALADAKYHQRETHSDTDMKEYIKDKRAQLDKGLSEFKVDFEGLLDEFADLIDEDLDTLENTFNEDSFEDVKEEIEYCDILYFADKYPIWQSRIVAIEEKVAKQKEEAAVEQAKRDEIRNNTYSAGMYLVGTDIPAGEYVVKGSGYLEISSDSSGTLNSIIANENFNNNSIVSVSDGQYLTVKRGTFCKIDYNPSISTTGGGMFKVGVHIPAGEYKIVGTSSYSAYVAVYRAPTHKIADIVMNDNFDGERYVTVSEGQYLQLSRCKISQ